MTYLILNKNGDIENRIVASEAFVISYCEKHGYTFERLPDPPEPIPQPEPESEPTVWDELAAAYMEGVNSAYEQ